MAAPDARVSSTDVSIVPGVKAVAGRPTYRPRGDLDPGPQELAAKHPAFRRWERRRTGSDASRIHAAGSAGGDPSTDAHPSEQELPRQSWGLRPAERRTPEALACDRRPASRRSRDAELLDAYPARSARRGWSATHAPTGRYGRNMTGAARHFSLYPRRLNWPAPFTDLGPRARRMKDI